MSVATRSESQATDRLTTTSTSAPATAATNDPTDANTVAYSALSSTQQQAFDRALEAEVQFVDDSVLGSPYVGDDYFPRRAAEPFRTHDFIRRNGTHYRISYGEEEWGLAAYSIQATVAAPPADANVVALTHVSTAIRAEVRWAVENGSHDVPAGQWDSLPQGFDQFEYVRHDGEMSRITVVHGDRFPDVMHVEPVE